MRCSVQRFTYQQFNLKPTFCSIATYTPKWQLASAGLLNVLGREMDFRSVGVIFWVKTVLRFSSRSSSPDRELGLPALPAKAVDDSLG
jgi:hypothetical protein